MQTAAALCPTCSAELPSGAIFCPRCGKATPPTTSGGEASYRPPEAGADAARHRELQRLLGDGYELRGLIGRGGFADVFEAWDVRLKRPLAIKTLRTDLETSEQLLERFRREAEAIARLRHPNVIPIYAVGGEGSVAYFVMPKVDGESLASRLHRESKLDVDECCRILREAAGALAAAHAAGMVHRDVKPENILLDGPQRRVLVTDFGIAKSAGPADKGLTGTGMMIGTPHYMSPEQATGERSIDHRSDQYSLAVVGYRILSGQLPFEGESTQSLIFKQVTEVPPPVNQIAPDVPAALSDVIQQALAKDARDRFVSMDAFDRAIGVATSGAPAPAGRRMRLDDMTTRIATMRRTLPGWASPVTIGAAILAIAGAWMESRPTSPTAARLATSRDEAVFAAKSFLVSRGVPAPFGEASTFTKAADQKYAFLAKNTPSSIEQHAATGSPIWYWHVRLKPDASKSTPWQVDVGPGNRIVGFRQVVSDTASAAAPPDLEALAIATRELAARQSNSTSLIRMADSTVRLQSRVDRIFRWRNASTAVPYKSDTAYERTSVRVTGSGVSHYDETLVLPRNWARENLNAGVFGVVLIGMLGAVILLATLLVIQMRHDDLQWRTCLKFGVAVVVLGLPAWLLSDARNAFMEGFSEGAGTSPPPFLDLIAQLLLRALGASACALLAAVVESLSAEHRPRAFAGIVDLMRGRFKTPEFVSAIAAGAVGAAVLIVILGAVDFVSFRITGAAPSSSIAAVVSAPVPAFEVLSAFSNGVLIALALACFQLAVFKWLKKDAWALVIPAALMSLILVMPSGAGSTPGELVHGAVKMVALLAILWRYGIIGAAVALTLEQGVLALVTMYSYGSGAMHPTFAAAVYALPFVLAVVAYRHLSTPAAAGARSSG